MGLRGAYAAGRRQFNQLANSMQKRFGGSTDTKTSTTFTGAGMLGDRSGGSISSIDVKSLVPSINTSELKGTLKIPVINTPKVENPKVPNVDPKP